MFYVSSNPAPGIYGVTDTEDGKEQCFRINDLYYAVFKKGIKILGIDNNGISLVNAAKVAQMQFGRFGGCVKRKIYSFSYEKCMDLASAGGFKRALKGLENNPEEYHKITYEKIYPQSVRDAVDQASIYTNVIQEVNVANINEVINALRNNVCLVLQHGAKGSLTSFICTASVKVMDTIYGAGVVDSVYLTKTLYDLTDVSYLRPENPNWTGTSSNPNMLKVFSCALRFRPASLQRNSGLMELSSSFYSVNATKGKLLSMFILNNPAQLSAEFNSQIKIACNNPNYRFDINIYNLVCQFLKNNSHSLGDPNVLNPLIRGSFNDGVTTEDVVKRFSNAWSYMQHIRATGYTFNRGS